MGKSRIGVGGEEKLETNGPQLLSTRKFSGELIVLEDFIKGKKD